VASKKEMLEQNAFFAREYDIHSQSMMASVGVSKV